MKRMTRRTVGIMLGLTLGWLAAGYIPAWFDAPTPTYAHVDEGAAEAGGHSHTPTSVDKLVPHHEDAPFHHTVLGLVVALFAGACVIGLFLRALGENDPSIVATEQDNAEAHHGHDEHADGGHEGHEESHGAGH